MPIVAVATARMTVFCSASRVGENSKKTKRTCCSVIVASVSGSPMVFDSAARTSAR